MVLGVGAVVSDATYVAHQYCITRARGMVATNQGMWALYADAWHFPDPLQEINGNSFGVTSFGPLFSRFRRF